MSTADNALKSTNKQVMRVYAAKTYKNLPWKQDEETGELPSTVYITVNIPEFTPTVPTDDSYEQLGLSGSFFENKNFPTTTGTIQMSHYLTLPIARGSRIPPTITYGTPFLLFMPTNKIEEGYLIYL